MIHLSRSRCAQSACALYARSLGDTLADPKQDAAEEETSVSPCALTHTPTHTLSRNALVRGDKYTTVTRRPKKKATCRARKDAPQKTKRNRVCRGIRREGGEDRTKEGKVENPRGTDVDQVHLHGCAGRGHVRKKKARGRTQAGERGAAAQQSRKRAGCERPELAQH